MAISALLIFWYLFFFRFWENPYQFATSEHFENYFSYWRWMGKQMRKGRGWFKDKIYYYNPGGIPFMMAWYPLQILTA
jgi:hypothetical protein